MAQWGNQDNANSAPVYTTNATTGESGVDEFGTAVFGVSTTEAKLINGVAPGWVRVIEGTGGRAGRKTYETLVAFGGMQGDDDGDNDVFPDGTIENTVLPEVTGTAQAGETLTTTHGTWSAQPAPTGFSVEWLADDVVIAGETGDTLVLTVDEEGAMITSRVTPISDAYNGTPATSEPVGPVLAE